MGGALTSPPACGWVFEPTCVFDEGKLLALLAGTKEVSRLKGVFRIQEEWIAVNRAGTAVSVSPTAYRRDSRLEVFAEGLDWDAFERVRLIACQLRRNEEKPHEPTPAPGFDACHARHTKSAARGHLCQPG